MLYVIITLFKCKKCEDKKRKKRNRIDHVKSEYQLKRIYRESYNCDNYQEGKKI